MLDGRIDVQGTVKELRSQGILEQIKHEESIQVDEGSHSEVTKTDDGAVVLPKQVTKLVQDEHRETGSVKWPVYKTYLKASYVSF